MMVVAAFFSFVAVLGLAIALLEVAAWSNHPAPSTQSVGGAGCGIFVIAAILAAVFVAGAYAP